MSTRSHCAAVVAVVLLGVTLARADEPPSGEETFRRGAEALAAGRFEDAIAELEAHADREPAHPDACFDRGLAYVLRVRSGAERAGDLGRAAAAFEETRLLRPDDDEARRGLELVRAEIARRRARVGKGVVLATPSLDRALTSLATPRAWSVAAIAAGWLLAVALWLRRRQGTAHLAGVVAAPLAGVLLLVLVPTALWSDHLDRHRRPAVLVAREAFLTSDEGQSQGGDPIVEGARVELVETRADRARVRYGGREGWIPLETLHVLARR